MPEEEQFKALERRIERLLLSQIDELGKSSDGKAKVYSPFPLFLLTCVGIETLGRIFYGIRPTGVNEEDATREAFVKVCTAVDGSLSRGLSLKQKEEYDTLWGTGSHKYCGNFAAIIYRLGRHTMVHGYQGRGVFLTEGLENWSFDQGAIVLNPYWFWGRFRSANATLWERFHSNKELNNPMKLSARHYLAELLG